MRCDELERRLDAAGPGALSAADAAHARDCARCASAIASARAVEAMLRASPPPAPAAMSARIMERVELVERARARLAESSRARPRGWLAAFAAEPAAAVALALAPVCLILWLALPSTGTALALLVRDATATAFAAAASGLLSAKSGFAGLAPHGSLLLDAMLVPALLAVSFFALQWIAEPFRGIRSSRSSRRARPPR